jgi:hypothetical protein
MTSIPTPQPELTISSLSRTCDRLLHKLLQDVETSFISELRDQAENNLGRFRVWANNIAAFKDPKSTVSLEYRLRDADEMLDRFKNGLQELIDSSTQGAMLSPPSSA